MIFFSTGPVAFEDMFRVAETSECWVKAQIITFCRTNHHVLIQTTEYINFRPKSLKLFIKSYVQAFYPYLTLP